jgi:hypothetical protein
MTSIKTIHKLLTFLIAAIWLINGLFCKVLNLVPRHQLIVARILGNEYAVLFTRAIGVAEIFVAIWIMSRVKTHLSAFMQIVVVAAMNAIEFFMAPDLLLFGKVNAILAVAFILVVYSNEFVLKKHPGKLQYGILPEK